MVYHGRDRRSRYYINLPRPLSCRFWSTKHYDCTMVYYRGRDKKYYNPTRFGYLTNVVIHTLSNPSHYQTVCDNGNTQSNTIRVLLCSKILSVSDIPSYNKQSTRHCCNSYHKPYETEELDIESKTRTSTTKLIEI